MEILEKAAKENGLVAAFAVVGLVVMVSRFLSRKLTFGRVQGSAIAILIGLALAYVGGKTLRRDERPGGHRALQRRRFDGRQHAARFRDRGDGI